MRYKYWHSWLISTHELNGICGIWGDVFCWHICGNRMVKRVANCCFVLFVCAVMWSLYIDYSSSALEHICTVRHACISAPNKYANNVKFMYTRVPVHTVCCSGFIWGIYTAIEVSCGHDLIGICSLYCYITYFWIEYYLQI